LKDRQAVDHIGSVLCVMNYSYARMPFLKDLKEALSPFDLEKAYLRLRASDHFNFWLLHGWYG